jgi:hypothetical protein
MREEPKEEAKKEDAKDEKKEADTKAAKPVLNAADKNQQVADRARKEAFEAVVDEEATEKEGTDDIAASHAKAADEASKQRIQNVEAYDY